MGLGITGMFKKDGTQFDGLGIVGLSGSISDGCVYPYLDGEQESGHLQDYTGVAASSTLLYETLLTFSSDPPLGFVPALESTSASPQGPQIHHDVVSQLTSRDMDTGLDHTFSGLEHSSPRGRKPQLTRDLSMSTISSELKSIPKKLKAGRITHRSKQVGPAWKI